MKIRLGKEQDVVKYISKHKEGISIIILMLSVFLILFLAFDFKDYNISMPFVYNGGDDFLVYKNAKMVTSDDSWIFETERLGAPYGGEYYDFMADSLQNVDNFLLKIVGIFVKDPVIIYNCVILFLFFAIALIAYYVLRKIGVRNDFAIMGALTFDFSYYHFFRMMGHFCLSCYEFVPLSVLLCVWLWKDEKLFCFGKSFFGYKKNYVVILLLFLMANNGIAYYPFFTCMFLGITALSKSIKEKKKAPILKMFSMVCLCGFFLLLALAPSFVYQMKNGMNLVSRNIWDTEQYALKIIQLLVPYKSHGIEKLETFQKEYYSFFTYTEAVSSYLGLIAGIGFLLLVLGLFLPKVRVKGKESVFILLVELNVFAILFATMGGFSSVFANFVTEILRGANRISIFIMFFAVAAVGILMTKLMALNNKGKKHKFVCCTIYWVFLGAVVWGLWDQIPQNLTGNSAAFMAEKQSDQNFIERIEDELPDNAMIYQLPYHIYPEGGPVNSMADYHLLIGYLYSDNLRWSYGGSKGRESDLWNQFVGSQTPDVIVSMVKEKGFAGIYIDKRAYTDEEFNNLIVTLNACIGHEPISSENGNLYFYKF